MPPETTPQPAEQHPAGFLCRLLNGLKIQCKDRGVQAELGAGGVAALSVMQNLSVTDLEQASEAMTLGASLGEFGVSMVKGAPAVVIGGIACPALGVAILAGTVGCAYLKVRQAIAQNDQAARTRALTEAFAAEQVALQASIRAEAEHLGLSTPAIPGPADLAQFIAKLYERTENDADSRAVGYLDVLQQSNRETQAWLKDYLDRNFTDLHSDLKEMEVEIKATRTAVDELVRQSDVRHEQLLSRIDLTIDRRGLVTDLLRETPRFVQKRLASFYGRDEWMVEHFGWIDEGRIPEARQIAVTAPPGTGKSSVMAELLRRAVSAEQWVVASAFFRPDWRNGTDASAAYVALIGALRRALPDVPEEGRFALPDPKMEALPGELSQVLNAVAERRSVLLLLDGLDECRQPTDFKLDWIKHLTDAHPNVVLVIGYRREDTEHAPNYAQSCPVRVKLPGLDVAGIEEWIARADEGQLRAQAAALAPGLHRAAQGLPLLAEYLIDDLIKDPTRATGAEGLPQGLSSYVKQQVEHLMENAEQVSDEMLDVLRVLSLARQPLTLAEIQAVTQVRPDRLSDARAPVAVRRWWNRVQEGAALAFAHPLLAQAFAQDDELMAGLMRAPLAEWCAKQEDGYAFVWGVIHLVEACEAEWNDAWAEEAVRRVTSLDYVGRKYAAGQEGLLHKELAAVEHLLAVRA